MAPVTLEIVLPPILQAKVGCPTCRTFMQQAGLPLEGDFEDYPEEFAEMARRLAEWVEGLRISYAETLKVELVDGLSPRGLWKQLRHKLRALPGFLVDGVRVSAGWNLEQVEGDIKMRMLELGMGSQDAPSPF